MYPTFPPSAEKEREKRKGDNSCRISLGLIFIHESSFTDKRVSRDIPGADNKNFIVAIAEYRIEEALLQSQTSVANR